MLLDISPNMLFLGLCVLILIWFRADMKFMHWHFWDLTISKLSAFSTRKYSINLLSYSFHKIFALCLKVTCEIFASSIRRHIELFFCYRNTVNIKVQLNEGSQYSQVIDIPGLSFHTMLYSWVNNIFYYSWSNKNVYNKIMQCYILRN